MKFNSQSTDEPLFFMYDSLAFCTLAAALMVIGLKLSDAFPFDCQVINVPLSCASTELEEKTSIGPGVSKLNTRLNGVVPVVLCTW